MKSFDPMNSGDEYEFEQQLRQLELRRPPAGWKVLLLPKPPVPWFPKPFAIGLTACWAVTGTLFLTTPKNEVLSPPLRMPSAPPSSEPFLLGYNQPENTTR